MKRVLDGMTRAERFREKRRRERWEKREEALAARPRVTVADAIWAAGYFEGEGTVTIYGTKWGRAACSITSTDPFVTAWFKARWGGAIYTYQPKGKARVAHRWAVNTYFAIECFLADLRPNTRRAEVAEKIDLVVAFIRSRARRPKDPAVLAQAAETIEAIRALNWRGTPDARQRWQDRGRDAATPLETMQ